MAVIWAPETEGDFARIHEYNTEEYGPSEADRIERFITDCGDQLAPGAGLKWLGLPIRRFRTEHPTRPKRISYMYNLFFRERGADVEILAIYAAREEWDVLASSRV